jgi:hypothetical protein
LGPSMCYNVDNQSVILMVTSLKTLFKRLIWLHYFSSRKLEQKLFFKIDISLPPICYRWENINKDFSLAPYVFMKLSMVIRFMWHPLFGEIKNLVHCYQLLNKHPNVVIFIVSTTKHWWHSQHKTFWFNFITC